MALTHSKQHCDEFFIVDCSITIQVCFVDEFLYEIEIFKMLHLSQYHIHTNFCLLWRQFLSKTLQDIGEILTSILAEILETEGW